MDKDTDNTLEKNKKTSNNESSYLSSSNNLKNPKRADAKGYNNSNSKQNHIKNNSNEKDVSETGKYAKPHQNYLSNKLNRTTEKDSYEEYSEDDASDSLLINEMVSNKKTNSAISGEFSFSGKSRNKYILLGGIGGVIIIFLLLIVTIITGKSPISNVGNGEENEEVKELKTEISEVKSSFSSKYGVTIDENLILATLIAYQDKDENESEEDNLSYMKSKIELLAKYQIITKAKCNYDSSTIRKIASNDKDELFGKEEKNYKCDSSSDEETYELSTERGDYSDDNSGGVYYWNLIDGDFITDYYKAFVSSDSSTNKKDEKTIHNIVEDIYDYYVAIPDDEDDTSSYNGVSSDKYWWPSGSSETETTSGKLFAKGNPVSTTITSYFGPRVIGGVSGNHGAIDIGLACGNNVIAAKDGTVVSTNDGCPTYGSYPNTCGLGYGNHVIIEHADGNYTLYGHMTLNSLKVSNGDTVKQGQVIGLSGSSGQSTGCHLHFEVRSGQNNLAARVDPLDYVDPDNPRPENTGLSHVAGSNAKQEICLSLKASGFSNNGIAAVLTNINAESSFNPNIIGDYGTSYGLCQWHDSRWDNLKSYTSKWQTVEGQLQFLIHELETGYTELYNSLLNGLGSANDLANKYCVQFEVPADTASTCATRASSYSSEMSNYVNNNCK